MLTIRSVSKHIKIYSSIIYSLKDLTRLYYSDWDKFIIRKYKKITKISSCNYINDYLSNSSYASNCPFINYEKSHNQRKLTHSRISLKKYNVNEIYSPKSSLSKPMINLSSFLESLNMNMSSNNITDKVLRKKLLDLKNFIFNEDRNIHGMFYRKATSDKLTELYYFSQFKNYKVYLKSNNHTRQNKCNHIGAYKSNETPKKMQTDFVRYFSSDKILHSLDDEKGNTKENCDKIWTKEINDNCKVTYCVKRNDNVEKVQFTVNCKDNGKNMQFSSENLSTGQKLIGAVMTLFLVIAAAYCTILFMSLAASVLIIATIIVFSISCYQIVKKGWKNRGR